MSLSERSLVTILAASTMILAGCGGGASQDDRSAVAAVDPHAGHDHGPGETEPAPPDPHAGHDHGPGETEPLPVDPHAGHDHEDEEGIIQIDERERAEFGIRLATAGPGLLSKATSLSGEVILNPDRVAHVTARAGGIGTQVLRTIGDRVVTGEILAVLESPELAESKAAYLARVAHAALAATDLARAETTHTNTIRLLEILAENPNVDALRRDINELDIGANRGTLITTFAQLRATKAIYDREKSLFEREISSESEYLTAENEFNKAVAGFQAVRDDLSFSNRRQLEAARRSKLVADVSLLAAERRLHGLGLDEKEVDHVATESDVELARYEIRPPIGGRIIERHLVRGESLDAGEQVFVIADLSSVWGQLTLYQRDLPVVEEGHSARIIATHGVGSTVATIEYIDPILDEQTRTTTARVILDNTDGNWLPGMFIRAELIASERSAVVLVPRSALQMIGDETILFVETAKGLERRDVQIGRTDTKSAEIVAGLRSGERFVVAGGLALRVELNKAALEHAGHAH